jgi:predicted O-methyltransferase YrrM
MENVRSSYKNNIDFNDIFDTITFLVNPKKIVEFGILDGYSLESFVKNSSTNCSIEAYDLFDDFNGNHAEFYNIKNKFNKYNNVSIKKGDFYKSLNNFKDKSIDILHIDIANDGSTYEYALEKYIHKISDNGIMILEGGSDERDNVEWMIKYNKPKINPVVEKYSYEYKIKIIKKFPSITIIKNI